MLISRANSALKERLVKEIISWSKGKDKVLNIITVPYSKSDVFEEIVFKYIKEDKKVLYIVNDEDGIKPVTEVLKTSSYKDYYLPFGSFNKLKEGKPFVITTYEGALLVQQSYDLVIYDDVSSLAKYSKFEILDLLSSFYKTSSKIICRSIEGIFQNAPCIEIPLGDKGIPLVEPRIITTRLDLTKEIPAVIYDYLKWSINKDRNVVIYAPCAEIAAKVHKYLLSIKENLITNILLYNDGRTREVRYFLEKRKGIIVTDNIDIIKMRLSDTDFVIYLAEDRAFEYKKMVYICSKVSTIGYSSLGEVILLSNEISRDMENCREIIRRFNKQIWDMGLVEA